MRRKRISNSTRRSNSARAQGQLKYHRFIGVDLGGGKNDRTSLAILDYYPGQKKLFLVHVHEHISQESEVSSDQILFELIKEYEQGLEYLCLDAPIKFPKCIRCRLKCPGYEKCKEPEIQWMWKQHAKYRKNKPRSKIFTPYTQRAAEIYLSTELDEGLHPMETLGANIAPLTARAHFLLRRLPGIKTIEVYPKVSVMRIGHSLKVPKSHTHFYKHAVGGSDSRMVILQALLKRDVVFIYQQDFNKLVTNADSFDAFISALTGFLKFQDQCEKIPKDFPKSEGWIEFPVKEPVLS